VLSMLFEPSRYKRRVKRTAMALIGPVGTPAVSYARIRQAVWVLEGELVVEEGGRRRALAIGDCLGFGPPADTTFANEAARACTYLVALARS
jgi:hypothetical protein